MSAESPGLHCRGTMGAPAGFEQRCGVVGLRTQKEVSLEAGVAGRDEGLGERWCGSHEGQAREGKGLEKC